jgi:DnaK suppressor protein
MDKSALLLKIKEKIVILEAEILELREMTKPIAPDVAIGRISRMDAINNKSVSEASLRNAENKLKALHYALQNIDNPEFGICAKCKQPIPEGRIILMPEKWFCVKCIV